MMGKKTPNNNKKTPKQTHLVDASPTYMLGFMVKLTVEIFKICFFSWNNIEQ